MILSGGIKISYLRSEKTTVVNNCLIDQTVKYINMYETTTYFYLFMMYSKTRNACFITEFFCLSMERGSGFEANPISSDFGKEVSFSEATTFPKSLEIDKTSRLQISGLKVLTTDSLQRKGIPDSDDRCYLDNYAPVGSSGLDFQCGG